jgi:Arc/MetJ-type ribon-helix-helix transcriptional regulator
MKRATITIPDELEAKLEEYVRRQEVPPALTAVVQTALREFLERRERGSGEREFRPFRITPAEKGSGLSDVSVNHDKYLAEAAYEDSFNEK